MKTSAFANDILKLIFQATTITGLADNTVTSPAANLYLSLHTANPTAAGNQTTSETAYTGYARMPLLRTSGGWTVTGDSVSPVADVTFGECTAAPGSALTYVGVGTALTGTGKLLYVGALNPSVAMALGVLPRITDASVISEA